MHKYAMKGAFMHNFCIKTAKKGEKKPKRSLNLSINIIIYGSFGVK